MSDLPREPLSANSEALPPPPGSTEVRDPQQHDAHPWTASPVSSDAGSKVDEAKGEVKQVADTAATSGKDVAATAKDEAKNVAAETKQQAGSLLDTVRSEVGQQASTSQSRIADALLDLSKELGGMASSSQESGPLTDLAHQASRKGGEIAHWLQDREPSDVVEDVRSYARRRPGTFLVLCGLAGVVAGRLTRSAVASRTSLDSPDGTGSTGARTAVGSDDATTRPADYVAADGGDRYPATPMTEPATRGSAGPSTGVYGGSLETTEPAARAETAGDATLPGSGFVGTSGALADPDGDRNR